MTTRREVEEVIERYGNTPRSGLPDELLDPRDDHDFNLSLALLLTSLYPGKDIGPVYDQHDELVAWRGIRLKTPEELAR